MNSRFNPYVGPRPFETGEVLDGRDRETLDLMDLLVAARIVLLYSPSGAGKTSLIKAALLPRLRQKGFNVLSPMRVNLEPPNELAHLNRYLTSALLALEESLPDDQRMPLRDLGSQTFASYLDRLMEANPARQVLIFDQFEEVLTVDPTNVLAKEEFFARVGEALENRKRWALFSLREDYLAELDPYLKLVPTRLVNTFRLGLLTAATACEAIQKPARRAGVVFTAEATSRLVDDLRSVRVQRPDGTTEIKAGQYIEPVQLQVVCLRLWEQFGGVGTIDTDKVAAVGDVNKALADYYADRVQKISAETREPERIIRKWFDHALITEHGLRGQVLMEPERSEKLSNQAIRRLENEHLVRTEERRGMRWFELAHDRLVEPIRGNNAAWFQQNLTPMQRQADLWGRQHLPSGLLANDKELSDAEKWAKAHADKVIQIDKDFLKESRKARSAVKRERRLQGLFVIAVFCLILAAAMIYALASQVEAYQSRVAATDAALTRDAAQVNQAHAETRAVSTVNVAQAAVTRAILARDAAQVNEAQALASDLAANSVSNLVLDPELSILLALESLKRGPTHDGEDALRRALLAQTVAAVLRHSAPVNSASYSPDGKRIVTASSDGTARIWDTETAKQLVVLAGHTADVVNASYSPDGKRIVTASRDSTARIWDSEDGRALMTLPGHNAWVVKAVFSPDGKRVATASDDKTARVWDAVTGKPLLSLKGHTDRVTSVAFSPDGRRIATGSFDGTAILWDASTGLPMTRLRGHMGALFSIEYSPDGRRLITASDDKTARVWDADSGKALLILSHPASVSDAVFSPLGGLQILTASYDKTARLWNASDGKELSVFRGHGDVLSTAVFSQDGQYAVTASADGTARIWYPYGRPEANILVGHTAIVNSAAYSPDGKQVATASDDKTARIWDAVTGQLARSLRGHTDRVTSVAFSPDGRRIATASSDGTAMIWDAFTSQPVTTLRGRTGALFSVRYSPDGKRLVTASDDQTAQVWDAGTGRLLAILKGHRKEVHSAAFSQDSKEIVTASADGDARLWDADTGQPIQILSGHTDAVWDAQFSPDGSQVVTASMDGTVRLWATATGQNAGIIKAHPGGVFSARFSPDGKRLLTAGADWTARVWIPSSTDESKLRTDRSDWSEASVLRGHLGAVAFGSFSPDGRQIATAGLDGTARIYLTQLQDLVALASQRVTRTLTQAERETYLHEAPAGQPPSTPTLVVASGNATWTVSPPPTPIPPTSSALTPVATLIVPTSRASPTATGTQRPTPQATPIVLELTATPVPTTAQTVAATPLPSPTGTRVPIAVTGGCPIDISPRFAAMVDLVTMGCPLATEEWVSAGTMAFQNGWMFWGQGRQEILVMYGTSWERYPDTWNEREQASTCAPTPPSGMYVPTRGFGKVWCQEAKVRQGLGWGIGPGESFNSLIQDFEYGWVFTDNQGHIILGFANGAWVAK